MRAITPPTKASSKLDCLNQSSSWRLREKCSGKGSGQTQRCTALRGNHTVSRKLDRLNDFCAKEISPSSRRRGKEDSGQTQHCEARQLHGGRANLTG
jgi:hypothetical protein